MRGQWNCALPGRLSGLDGCGLKRWGYFQFKYDLVFREDHSLTVVAPNGAGPRGRPVSKRSGNTCTNFRNGVLS